MTRKIEKTHIGTGVPILGLTGVNGAGKTLLGAHICNVLMASGREVYSTVPIKSEWGESKPVENLVQLLFLRDVTIFFDEIAAIFPSSSTNLPPEIDVLLQSLRHKGITVIWTAPTWMRAHKRLREMTQGLVNVIPVGLPRALQFRDELWPTPALVMAGLMDTKTGKVDSEPTKVLRRRVYRPRKLSSWGAYDTLADTPMIGGQAMGGICAGCFGSQTIPKHSKERHDELGIPYYDDLRLAIRKSARSVAFEAPAEDGEPVHTAAVGE